MLPKKGTWKDSPKNSQPDEFAYEVVNGIISKNLGGITNEPGAKTFSPAYNALGYKQVGLFNAKYGDKVVFSITDSPDADKIGIIKADGSYVNKLTAKLGFDELFPIDCELYYDYKGDLIIAFTDNKNTPKLINLNKIVLPFNLNEVQLYSFFTQPLVTTQVLESGGSHKSGTYYPFFGYKNDDTSTPYTQIENPIFISPSLISGGFNLYSGAVAGSATSKAIKLNIKSVDTTYKKLVVGMISKIDGVLDARIIREITIIGSEVDVTITGAESSTAVTLTEVITPSSVYNRIKHLTQLDGVLYGAGVSESSPIDFQKYACAIRLGWTSTLINPQDINQSYKVHAQNGLRKSYMHEEAYAFYVKVKIKGRGFSQWFHIPGRQAEGIEDKYFAELPNGQAGGQYDIEQSVSPTAKYYQIRDTSGANGKFGFWENQDEVYPNELEYVIPGGEDLRGKKVRHHRFPSIRKLGSTLYTNSDYGIKELDILGVEVLSFPTLPAELAAIVEGYEIGYAKRDTSNSLVNGQSLLEFMSRDNLDVNNTKKYWTGGNWDLINRGLRLLKVDTSEVRFNSFDLMLDKPSINPSYISAQIKMSTPVNSHTIRAAVNDYALHLDYARHETIREPFGENDDYKKISNFKYIPAHANTDDYVNLVGEETAVAKIDSNNYDLDFPIYGLIGNATNVAISRETTFLVNLMAYRINIYNALDDQTVVSTGRYINMFAFDKKMYGGDINIGMYGYVTFGQTDTNIYNTNYNYELTTGAVKTIRAFVTEGYNNHLLRHDLSAEVTTKYYPKEIVGPNNAWILNLPLSVNPNRIAYNKDYTAVNDLNIGTIFSVENKFIADDPYKIIRSRIPNKEERESSWKVFLANDYYIIPRDKGYITNIQGAGKELFINCEFALLKTRGSDELATDTFKVVLGTGNIFDRPPVELVVEEGGYAGCQHKYSCLLTKYGYFFVDEDKKKVFMANDTVKDITTGLRDFFREKLKTTGDNPYRGKGYTVAWDGEFERIVLSSKEAVFTRSYTPENETWTSKHTYYPNLLLGDRNSLFALKDGKIYKHNDPTLRGEYYGEAGHEFIVVVIFRDKTRQITLTNLTWRTNVVLNEATNKDITFNKVLAWNSYQATTEKTIVPFSETKSLEENFDTSNARRIKNEWNFNKLSNTVVVKNTKIINDINLVTGVANEDIDFYLKKPLSDDYVAIKLLFSNQKIGILYPEIQLLDISINANPVAR